MQIFSDTLPVSPDIAEFAIGLAKDWELNKTLPRVQQAWLHEESNTL